MSALARFAGEKYLSLETYRRSGAAVATTVWFVEDRGILYVSAPAHTGKVKRVRHTARVRVVPCDAGGRPLGRWVDGRADFADAERSERAERLLDRKYGWQKKLIGLWSLVRRWRHVVIAVRVAAPAP